MGITIVEWLILTVEYMVAHYLQRFVAQILGILVGIVVVGTALAMVTKPCVVVRF